MRSVRRRIQALLATHVVSVERCDVEDGPLVGEAVGEGLEKVMRTYAAMNLNRTWKRKTHPVMVVGGSGVSVSSAT
jgi:hypothetical protein